MQLSDPDKIDAMLESVNLDTDSLFQDIPQPVQRSLDLPEGQPDRAVEAKIRGALEANTPMTQRPALLGAGAYAHWLPPETRYMAQRGELLTAYTPYQAEINQGILQSLFEFQTLTARLLELDVANTGMYDGASAAAEAVLMAIRITRGRDHVLVPDHVPAQRRSILENYITGAGGTLETIPTNPDTGTTDLDALNDALSDDTACVHIEHPNAYGCLEPLDAISELAHDAGAKFTVHVPEVTALGTLHGPGHYGADIATAEGQPLALGPSFGGPALGLFATKEDYLRKMPGRLVGQTEDADKRQAYCLTLQTREQHIRRSRATSNICTNQSFLAVLFTVTLAAYGETGIQRLAQTNAARGQDLKDTLNHAGAHIPFQDTAHYNEILYQPPNDTDTFRDTALANGVDPGIPTTRLFDNGPSGLIACITETTPPETLDTLRASLQEVA